jgi:hypothetical protein
MSVRFTPGGRFVETFEITPPTKTIQIKKFPARVAYGARKPRVTCVGGAVSTPEIARRNDRRVILTYAYNSHNGATKHG